MSIFSEPNGKYHPLAPLASYSIDVDRGFIPAADPLQSLPAAFEAWEQIASDLSGLIRSRKVRKHLAALPILDASALSAPQEQERALLLLCVFANAWVWAGDTPNLVIPAPVAKPLCDVAATLDRPPITHYASMALNNWRRLDVDQPLSSNNARMLVQFLGGIDEDWFFMGSLGVELAGAPLLSLVHAATSASDESSDSELSAFIEGIAAGMEPVLDALGRMRDWCDPYIYYHRVRPYLSGWPEPGVIYEGVSTAAQKYMGGSAGQSSLIQAIDALLGVTHEEAVVKPYLRSLRRYMPVGHRHFVEEVTANSRVRARAEAGSPQFQDAYNMAVEQVALFRQRHMALARDYITIPSGTMDAEKGTGGTSFTQFLRDAQQETTKMRL